MERVRLFTDSDVLYSRVLRDWLMHARSVTEGEIFSLLTSEDVVAEVLARLRDNNPRWDGGQISSVSTAIHEMFDHVLDDFPGDVVFPGDDDGDVHVHAAALEARAMMLLTRDDGFLRLRDDERLPYEPIEPDGFFVLLDEVAPDAVREMTQRQINFWTAKGERADLDRFLRAAGCPQFAEVVALRTAELGGRRATRVFLQAQIES